MDKDEKGRFVKGHSLGKRFVKGQPSANKGRKYICNIEHVTRETAKAYLHKGYLVKSYGLPPKMYFEHVSVFCGWTGLKNIPEGNVIHHIDGNKLNNEISNLVMLTKSEHSKLHRAVDTPAGSLIGINKVRA